MTTQLTERSSWIRNRIARDQIDKYRTDDGDFIPDAEIEARLRANREPDPARIRAIIAKSEAIQTLEPDETAALLHVTDPDLWTEMKTAAARIKRKVYDNRIVTFAPLYLSNRCVNNCLYCGLRCANAAIERRVLTQDEIRREAEVLAGQIGHKRLIVVYGEHPDSAIDYMAESLRTIYSARVKARIGFGQIRRINVNAPPLRVEELKILHEVGLGTYQVFQETYHHDTYARLHPAGTIKGDYAWRLYAMHRAMEAGIDDVGLGALFGLADWRFEVMGLLYHARELERAFGIGPHTISFPRLEPAESTPFTQESGFLVSDEDMERAVVVLRLSVPYTGMILTARENAGMRRRLIPLGCTQTDASSRIGVGAYSEAYESQQGSRQQFLLGDTRSLDDVVRELAEMGYITSFCTAGYRCGRTGQCIMDLLRSGREGKFCKLNAVLTFREWLDDFASPATQAAGEKVLQHELAEIREQNPKGYPVFMQFYERTARGERDLFL
ncbi:MAG TPA: [FeFe] hydrogenase H-cluster radical SAM maturase HydG [Kiritimatiellia bacterium]|nr:[FeFe] hydrogenase H-cluster radical SAM maturase HydG [Kiritimatiellia bacterium]HRZ11081.1 [FeFe] hydrogenase H-cluster radical SAM maturase HydG [Kiritimatiellia bacterium]HSA18654.1 [FeFe] hydrogenase H-cluster radical SAM maturase HydG [Kiritimatiellia bacterium]